MKKKIVTLLTAGSLVLASITPTCAANYEPITGETAELNKYLVMKNEAEVPNGTFNFTIAPGTAVEARTGVMPILAGVSGATITNSVRYAQGDTTTAETTARNSDTYESIDWQTAAEDDEKVAKKTVTANFTGCSFTEPGIYRYVITESGSIGGVTNDANDTRLLDVYVEDRNGTLAVSSYVLHQGTDSDSQVLRNYAEGTSEDVVLDDKSTGFSNVYNSQNLTFGKEVTGNQGSKDKYFEFTLSITGATAGNVYTVDISKADATPSSNSATTVTTAANPTSITVGTGGSVTQKFYLQDGQYITVKGIEKGAHYEITEDAEDYAQTAEITAQDSSLNYDGTEGNDALSDDTSGTIGDEDVYTGYTNTREGIIPTGIITKVGPVVGCAIVLVIAILVLFIKSNKEDEEEA